MLRLKIFTGVSATLCIRVYTEGCTKVCTSVYESVYEYTTHKYIYRYAGQSPGMIYEYTHVSWKRMQRDLSYHPEFAISGGCSRPTRVDQ